MTAEDYWQTAGKHKSNIGGSSVISKLSVAGLIFINQDDPLINHLIQGCRNPVFKQVVFWFSVKKQLQLALGSSLLTWEDRKPGNIAPVTECKVL